MLKQVNLCLSSLCGANCIFCPTVRGKETKSKLMSFETAKQIIDEIEILNKEGRHSVMKMEIGENGDAFINPELIRILRYIKLKLPKIEIEVFTNFQNLTADKTKCILTEKLINRFNCNIDGSNKRIFFLVKKLDLNVVSKNIMDFLRIRSELKGQEPLKIIVLTLNSYIKTIHKYFGTYPLKLNDLNAKFIPDDFQLIKKQWEMMIDPKIDSITRSPIFTWAEKEHITTQSISLKRFSCPNLKRIREEAFIAPNGTWYACCFDPNNELVLGNVLKDGFDIIFNSEIRSRFIELLEKRDFDKIGGPCGYVFCCQSISYNNIRNNFKDYLEDVYSWITYKRNQFKEYSNRL